MKVIALVCISIAFFGCVSAVPAAGSLNAICNYYSTLTGLNNSALIGSVVGDVVNAAVSPNSTIKKYFDGTFPAGSTNFLNSTAALNSLFGKLVSFFGLVLNCTDGTIPAYTGRTMTQAHATMQTTFSAFSVFNNAVVSVLLSKGVNQTDANLVADALNGQRGACSAADCASICNKYTNPSKVSNQMLVGAVVDGSVNAALNPANGLRQFFNGSVPAGSIDFTTNTAQYTRLRTNLINFFGLALGCSDGTIPPYTGKSMALAHAGIPIGNLSFVTFNGAVLSVMKGAGVDANDLIAVAGVLESTRPDICTLPDCRPANATMAATSAATAATSAPISVPTSAVVMTSAPSSAAFFAPAFFLSAILAAFF